MRKHIQRLIMAVLAVAAILSTAIGVLATEEEHVHNWVIQSIGTKQHTLRCDGCYQHKTEDHTVDSDEICTVCGKHYHPHNWQCEWSNSTHHCVVCTTCQEKETVTHSNNSDGICKVCGYTPHEHIWKYKPGQKYDTYHELYCTQCDSIGAEDHIYGADEKCTVCGSSRPHEHQWESNGKQTDDPRYHSVVCYCGATSKALHDWWWDGKTGSYDSHTMVCTDCRLTRSTGHIYTTTIIKGAKCATCGYPVDDTNVVVTDPNQSTTTETKPTVTKPKDTNTTESTPVETTPTETPTESPDETAPAETKPTQTKPVGSEPTDTEPTASETMPQNTEKAESPSRSSLWVWITVVLVAVGGLGAVVFFLKKKTH